MVAYTGTAEGRAWSHRVDEPIIYVSKLLLLLLAGLLIYTIDDDRLFVTIT